MTLPTGASATGWGSETSQDFADYIEAAETKALGRALAALGFGTQFTRDYDFAEAAAATAPRQQVVDAPVGLPQAVTTHRTLNTVPSTSNGNNAPARPAANGNSLTDKQLKAIYAIGRAAQHLSEDEVDACCQAAFGCRPEELSRLEASQFIDMLKGVQAA